MRDAVSWKFRTSSAMKPRKSAALLAFAPGPYSENVGPGSLSVAGLRPVAR